MSYTPPAGNAVNVKQIGVTYYAPAGNAANVTWAPQAPRFGILSSSKTSFVGFFSPYVDTSFSIASGSSLAAVTWQRNFSMSSGSAPNMQSGSQFHLSLTSVLDYKIGNFQSGNFALLSSSTVAGAAISTHKSQAAITSGSTPRLRGAYNVDVKMYVQSGSTAAFKQRSIVNSVFSGTPLSKAAFVSASIKPAAFSIGTSSSPALRSIGLGRAHFAIGSSSLGAFSGNFGTGTKYAISSLTSPSFISSFGFSSVPSIPDDADVVFVHTKQNYVVSYGV